MQCSLPAAAHLKDLCASNSWNLKWSLTKTFDIVVPKTHQNTRWAWGRRKWVKHRMEELMQLTVSAGTGCSAYELARSQQRLVNQTEAAQKISDPSRHFFSDNQERKKIIQQRENRESKNLWPSTGGQQHQLQPTVPTASEKVPNRAAQFTITFPITEAGANIPKCNNLHFKTSLQEGLHQSEVQNPGKPFSPFQAKTNGSANSHCQSLQTLNPKLLIWCSGRARNFPKAHRFLCKLGIGLAVDAGHSQFPSTCCLWDEAEIFMKIPFSALCWCCTKSWQKDVLSVWGFWQTQPTQHSCSSTWGYLKRQSHFPKFFPLLLQVSISPNIFLWRGCLFPEHLCSSELNVTAIF